MRYIALAILFALLLIIIGPIAVIWALNTLFKLDIPTNFETWCAVAILSSYCIQNRWSTKD